ncbi:MAG: Xaa-Pro aminopeptidase [Gammaproteobacteria bacterium]
MKQDEYQRRRKALKDMMGDHCIAIIPSASEQVRNRDVLYPFRQDSDFQYLTGFPEPDAVAVLVPGREHGEFILFCREKDPAKETWDGYRAGQEGAMRDYGADDSFPIDDVDDILPGLMERCEKVFCTMGEHPDFDQRVLSWVNQLRQGARAGTRAPTEFVALEHLLHEMRLFKHKADVTAMRHAAKISIEAHQDAMRICRPGMMEYEVEAALINRFKSYGTEPAYPSIVGGGANGCVLHYISNNAKLRDGDLLLIDAGTEFDCYASDITRTFPVNGRYSGPQRDVYQLVLDAQLAAIEEVQPGKSWNDFHERAVQVLTQGLVDLKLLEGNVDGLIESQAYRRFYMHRTGHWLGMDVHDVGDYKVDDEWRILEPGMVLTVEPGLYITAADDVDERFHNIGIRIEDDVLVTKQGHDVLTEAMPKRVDDVEALMAG